jgi:hypothetical protein
MTNQHLPGATQNPHDSFTEDDVDTGHNMTIVAPSSASVFEIDEEEALGLREIEYGYGRRSSASGRASGSRLRTSTTLEEDGRFSESREGIYPYSGSSDRRHGPLDDPEHRYNNNGNL